jgi:hypothetical protein
MREPTLHKIAISVVAAVLGSAILTTDAVAAGGRAGGSSVIAGDRGGSRFGAPRFEPRRFGRGYYPFGYYGGYGGYGSSSNNGCISLDAYGCEE